MAGQKGILDGMACRRTAAVKAFAERHIAELDLMIASEQRRAEAEREMRNRSYDEDDELADNDGNEGGPID